VQQYSIIAGLLTRRYRSLVHSGTGPTGTAGGDGSAPAPPKPEPLWTNARLTSQMTSTMNTPACGVAYTWTRMSGRGECVGCLQKPRLHRLQLPSRQRERNIHWPCVRRACRTLKCELSCHCGERKVLCRSPLVSWPRRRPGWRSLGGRTIRRPPLPLEAQWRHAYHPQAFIAM
jgi:hypothetical protein